VIRQLYQQADLRQRIEHSKILYRDSMKKYDGIKIKDGRFFSFYSIQEKELKEAIKKAFKK
jgi:transposase-like protein